MEEPSENCRKLNSSSKLYPTVQTNPPPPLWPKRNKTMLKLQRLRFKGGQHVSSLSTVLLLLLSSFLLFLSPSPVSGQPFLNSLAVLFRARPPWPTTFPSSKFTAIPSPLLSAQGSHQGILVAHPISPTGGGGIGGSSSNGGGGSNYDSNTNNDNNNNINDGGSDSSKNKDTIETAQSSTSSAGHSAGGIPPAPSPQQNFIPLPSSPTISPPIPVFPPPIQMFQNGQHVIPGPGGHNIVLHQGLPPGHHPHHLQKLQKIPPNSPLLLSSPTSLVGSIAFPDPPTTVPNPHYGMLLENTNNNNQNSNNNYQPNHHHSNKHHHHHHHHHPHHHKQKHHHHKHHAVYRDNAWNPLWLTLSNNTAGGVGNSHSNSGGNGQRGFSNNNHHNNQQQQQHSTSNSNSQHSTMTGKENARRQKKLKDFRPSPQLNSFVETTVISDYNAHVKANGGQPSSMTASSKEKQPNLTADQSGSAPLSHYPRFESGFRPISFNQYAAQFGTTATRPHYTNSQQQYFNPWSIAFDPNNPQTYNQNQYQYQENGGGGSREDHQNPMKPFRQDRQIVTAGAISQSVVTTAADVSVEEGSTEEDGEEGNNNNGDNNEERRMMHQADGEEDGEFVYVRGKKKSSGEVVHQLRRDNKGKSRHRFSSKGKKHQQNHRGPAATTSSTTASSELVEEWLPPNLRIQKKSDGRRKYPTFAKKNNKNIPKGGSGSSSSKESQNGGPKGMMKLPDKCDKFHKFGFCPVTRQYPLDAAEKIASRCSALLSHLIAPLPKMDVQYDIAVEGGGRNGTTTKGRSTGWSWKSYQGKPVCDTDELTTVPGWAKNEYGDWMIILQTKLWQQKAHISLCSPSATHCQGLICNNKKTNDHHNGGNHRNSKERRGGSSSSSSEINLAYTKCVQRFTAQRLAVFDPDNPDFCPVVRSVFLPSACVCLTSTGSLGTSGSSEHNNNEEDEARSYSGRQPLFSSNSSEEDMQVSLTKSKKTKNSKERDSREEKNNGTEKSTGKVRVVGPVYVYSQAANSNSREGRKSHREGGSSHSNSNSFESSSSSVPLSNGTFMIITEKFTTNESSKETTDVVPVSSTTKNDTTVKTDNGMSSSSNS